MRIKEIVHEYLRYLQTLGRSGRTIENVGYGLRNFIRFLEQSQIYHIEDITRDVVADYQQDLAFYLTPKKKLMEIESQVKILSAVTGFSRYIKQKDYLISDPAEAIKLPKIPKRLPKVILNENEIKKILNTPDMKTNTGYRDRIIMELLYDTGIRRSEVLNIKTTDLDLDAGFIRIHGKGNKERVVPLSKRVCDLVKSYTLFIRPAFINGEDNSYLLISRFRDKMKPAAVGDVVRRISGLSGIKKHVTTHTFRHTCASHMLRNGAPIRHIQEMLGHESLESTQIYTRVTINDLKKIHAKYHPSESMKDK